MNRLRLIRQHDEKDCGVACLAMILEYYGKKIPLANLKEDIKVDQYGANAYGIIDAAEKYDLTAEAMEGTVTDLFQATVSSDIHLPAIARIVNSDNYEHFVVISKIKDKNIHIFDPGIGRYVLLKKDFEDIFLGNIIIFEKCAEFKPENLRKNRLRYITDILKKQKGLLLLVTVLSFAVAAISFSGTFIFQFLIDHFPKELTDHATVEEYIGAVALLITALGILYIFKFIIQILRGKLSTLMIKKIDLSLILGSYNHISQLPMNFFSTHNAGDILSRFSDASRIRDAISGATVTILLDTVLTVVCGFILYKQSPSLFYIALTLFAVYFLISVIYIKPIDKSNRKAMEHNSRINSYIKETIDGMELIKSSQAEETAKEKVNSLFNTTTFFNLKSSMLDLSKNITTDLVASIGLLVVLWAGVINVVNGSMTVGTLITFCSLLSYFIDPIQNLLDLQDTIQTALIASDRLNDILYLSLEKSGDVKLEEEINTIEFDNVSFRYGNRNLTLDTINLSISKGEKIAFVGESGSGKSTLTQLIMGMYHPEKGAVKVNDIPVRDISLNTLRSKISYVPQSPFFFTDTIRNNLILGLPAEAVPDDDTITKTLELCHCNFIKELPMGIDTMLEENGANLSGGQLQRLAIARALLRKPQAIILDEATSALDSISEATIRENLKKVFPGLTVIMIAHRLNTIQHCDSIFVMKDGTIVESGTHDQLLNINRLYSELWNMQHSPNNKEKFSIAS